MDEVFEVLADPTRRRIVEALNRGEHGVSELVARVDIAQSGVSRHLRILHEAGFVEVRAEGQRRIYALRADRFREIDGWLDAYRRLWEGRLDAFGAALERKTNDRQRR